MTPSHELLVDKAEALQLVNQHISKPGVIDLPVLQDLLMWQHKLTQWLKREKATS